MHCILTVKFLLFLVALLLSLICCCCPDGLCEAPACSLSFLLPYPVTLWTQCFFNIKKWEPRGERPLSVVLAEAIVLTQPALLLVPFSWHMWHSGPIWWWHSSSLPYKNVSFASPFKQQDMVSHHPYVPLGSYYATVFLVGMVVCGQMCVCIFLCVYIFGWMMDGWMGECTVPVNFHNKQLERGTPLSKQTQSHWISEVLSLSCSSASLSFFLI